MIDRIHGIERIEESPEFVEQAILDGNFEYIGVPVDFSFNGEIIEGEEIYCVGLYKHREVLVPCFSWHSQVDALSEGFNWHVKENFLETNLPKKLPRLGFERVIWSRKTYLGHLKYKGEVKAITRREHQWCYYVDFKQGGIDEVHWIPESDIGLFPDPDYTWMAGYPSFTLQPGNPHSVTLWGDGRKFPNSRY